MGKWEVGKYGSWEVGKYGGRKSEVRRIVIFRII
jgi:hypothetical protein